MRQEHDGSRAVLIGAGEVAMRLRESTHTVVKALAVLKEQGRAEETHVRGRWRLHLTVHAEQEFSNPMCEASPTRN
jgi:DNA-binding IclR family transcriptional regulator